MFSRHERGLKPRDYVLAEMLSQARSRAALARVQSNAIRNFIGGPMKYFLTAAAMIALALTATSSPAPRSITTDPSVMTRAGLPTEQMAKTLLSEALQHRHPQW